MTIIGLDIGTTTLSAVVLDAHTLCPLDQRTIAHCAFLPSLPHERIQDAGLIERLSLALIEELRIKHAPVAAIGLTGQMHGIVYISDSGEAVSPLYTWQDGRGNLPMNDGRSFAEALSEEAGFPLASGYGYVTHMHLLRNGALPEGAVCFSTIHAYLAMKLAGCTRPVLHASDAASIGCFDLVSGRFDERAMDAAGRAFFPETVRSACVIGKTGFGAQVMTAIGDNQASFLGAMGDKRGAVLANIGTGSQISMRTDRLITCPGCETRPLDGGEYLLAGAPLCGGRAYAILEKFLRECASLAGAEAGSLYERMNELALTAPANPISVDTRFSGTREQPALRGSISGIGEDNFTPAHLIYATLTGMANELHAYCRSMAEATGTPASILIASGNAVRLNPALQRILSEVFALPLELPCCTEEAATGAAYLARRLVI